MTSTMRNLCAGVLTLVISAAAYADCTCKAATNEDGWCKDCKVGFFSGVKVKSEQLHKALQGEAVKADKMSCGGCKEALAKSTQCCGTNFAGEKAYGSPVAAKIARGKVVNAKEVKCGGCKEALKSNGWCKECKGGAVAGRFFAAKALYTAAKEAYGVLVTANKASAKCGDCAVAMVTDGDCSGCKVSFKDGKLVKKS